MFALFHLVYEPVVAGLAALLILCGVDDLIPALICLRHRFETRKHRKAVAKPRKTERRIAVFVPCWRESAVIAGMVRHNVAAIRYEKYEIFLGVYPNDPETVQIAHELSRTIKNVHVALCANAGPTSKADCLNCVFQQMIAFEKQRRIRFDTVVIHDAEDVIHPQAFSLINQERERYEMVQVPVLPLPTAAHESTHAIYCEDFAEYQTIDMRARQISGSFVPSNGVGTGYSRAVLMHLAKLNNDIVFEPSSLTEDYESGFRIHALGYAQTFCSLRQFDNQFLATREYFPRRFRAAVRQRTRWVMGNCLQSWERHGWRGSLAVRYWLWRDRKGLLTSPLGLAANLLFLSGVATWVWSAMTGQPWPLRIEAGWVNGMCGATLAFQTMRLVIRMECTRRVFGATFAAVVPFRFFHGNLINGCATVSALYRYAMAKRRKQALAWLKTDHAYPARQSLEHRHRTLEQVLNTAGLVSRGRLDRAKSGLAEDIDLADYLIHAKSLTEESLGKALGLKEGVASVYLAPADVNPHVARVIPFRKTGAGIIPFRVDGGRLLVAGARIPNATQLADLKKFTRMPVDFHLVTWRNFEELRQFVV